MKEIPISSTVDAREIVRARLRDQPPEVIETAVLLTNELVSNAIEHGAGRPSLSVELEESRVRIGVQDEDPTLLLAPREWEPTRDRGRVSTVT